MRGVPANQSSKLRLGVALAAALLSIGAMGAAGVAAASALTFAPCPSSPAFGCASLPVPLERNGAVPGTISLGLELNRQARRPPAAP